MHPRGLPATLTTAAGTETIWVEMDPFTQNRALIGVPTTGILWDIPLGNVTINSTAAAVPSNNVAQPGKMEFAPSNYSQAGGNSALFDYDDSGFGATAGYGSMQIHVGTNTLFGFNAWGNGASVDIGIGNQPVGNPDWTLAGAGATYTSRVLEVFVK